MINVRGGFRQLGLVVADAGRTIRYMEETLGVGPFRVLSEITLGNFHYRGAPARSPVLNVGLAQAGPIQIEIVQQLDDAPSAYREFLESGREGCHHLAVWFSRGEDFDEAGQHLQDRGLPVIQWGGSPGSFGFAFFESALPGSPMIELSWSRARSSSSPGRDSL